MKNTSLEFKNNLPSPFILNIYHYDLSENLKVIKERKKTSPMMFAGLQVILDVSSCNNVDRIDWHSLKELLIDESIIPIGLMTDNKELRKKVHEVGLGYLSPILSSSSNFSSKKESFNNHIKEEEEKKEELEIEIKKETVVINRIVRSGQQIYSQGDLIIVGSVSAGAEVIADGNIHIYGSLLGRALAGASGDNSAHIFCQSLRAEIIAISDNYLSYDEIDDMYINKFVHTFYDNGKLNFKIM